MLKNVKNLFLFKIMTLNILHCGRQQSLLDIKSFLNNILNILHN